MHIKNDNDAVVVDGVEVDDWEIVGCWFVGRGVA